MTVTVIATTGRWIVGGMDCKMDGGTRTIEMAMVIDMFEALDQCEISRICALSYVWFVGGGRCFCFVTQKRFFFLLAE
jgi:hypothetical protein